MRKVGKSILVMLLLLSMAVSLFAGGQGEAEKEQKIVMWAIANIDDTDDPTAVTLKDINSRFTEETGIKIEYESVPWDQIATKLAVQAQSGGEMPDVVEVSSQHLVTLLRTGALQDISSYVKDFSWYSQLNASDLNAAVIGGKRYAITADVRAGAWYYRVSDFPDGWPTTPQGWEKAGARLKSQGKYLAAFYANKEYASVEGQWGPWFYSNGGRIFDDEGKPVWASKENIEVVNFIRGLKNKGYFPDTNWTGDFAGAEAPWEDGSAAALRGGSWSPLFVPGLQEAYDSGKVKLGTGLSFGKGNYVFMVGEGWTIPKGASKPELAAAYLDFFMKDEIRTGAWAVNHYGIPTVDAAFKSAEAFKSKFYMDTAKNIGENGIFMEPSENYSAGLNKLAEALQSLMLNPALDVKSELEKAQKEILDRYYN